MNIGAWDVQIVETGRFALDGGAMFGVVPRALWSRSNPPDDRNRIAMAARTLLLRGHGRTMLVDTGNGDKWEEKLGAIYGIGPYTLDESLRARGLAPADITDVLLTHLHFDHAGGSTVIADGAPVPRFPNARYSVQSDNLKWARRPTEKDRASYLKENFEPLAAEGVLETIDGGGAFAPGVELTVLQGHTRAMQVVRVHDGDVNLLFCCDLVPTATHVSVPYVMAYDNFPLTTIEEKKSILGRAAEEGWILVFEHDPSTPAARIEAGPKGFAIKERVTL